MNRAQSSFLLVVLTGAACSGLPRREPLVAQNREIDSFAAAAAYPNSEPAVAIIAAQQFLAARREREGYEHFQRLAREQPDRAVFLSLEGLMQARMANDVSLLRRVGWVNEAIGKLDRGARGEPVVGRLIRGLVFAELPDRFGKATEAVADLEASLANRGSIPLEVDRGIYRALALAHRTLGNESRSRDMLQRSGTGSLDEPGSPSVLGNFSVDAQEGFRFTNPKLVREGEGVYVAEGFDFANIAFIVDAAGVVAIDGGTNEESARAAVKALRRITQAPIRTVILTHAHWDHIGGLPAVREPGTVVIARANFDQVLKRMQTSQQTFGYFFGTRPIRLDATVDRFVSRPETLRHGDLELQIIPAPSGETEDALFVNLPERGLLFVGDVFMPYVGAPFISEGSPEGYLETLATVRSLAPRRLIHGHPPLTRFFTAEAVPGLERALRDLHHKYLPDALHGRPLADMLHENYLPPSLRETPKTLIPYLVVRDHFLQRLHHQRAGYWLADGEGLEPLTRAEWAAVLDQFGGGREASFVRIAEDLVARGDAALALRVADMGLLRHPASERLEAARRRALSMLIERYSTVDPFRFIVYSQFAGAPMRPVVDTATPPTAAQETSKSAGGAR